MMKIRNTKLFTLVTVSTVTMIACNPLAKMVKRQGEINYEVTPNPAEMHGGDIEITLNGSFPTKYFNKKVSATVTPVIVYGENSLDFDIVGLKGEASEAEGITINYEKGGSFSHTAKVPYEKGMEEAVIELRVAGEYKGKTKDLEPRKVADGTIITPKLVMASDKAILGTDKYEKFTMEDNMVDIHYLVNNATVRGAEMLSADMKALKSKIKDWSKDEKIEFNSLIVNAYASPEGELSKNDNLANERAASAARALVTLLKRYKIDVPEAAIQLAGKGEDWSGFKKLMQSSDIKDKDLILRVLEQYADLNRREQEIKNLASTYSQVARKVLPELRAAKLNLVMKHHNLSDDEIKGLVSTNIDSLNVEQMLYAASLYTDPAKKESIYKSVVRVHSSDWRGPNNLGFMYLSQNKLGEAKTQFEKANGLSANNPIIDNNLGVIARLNGDMEAAMDYYNKAEGAGSEVAQNKGIINIIKGNYPQANSNYAGVKSFNAALAALLSGDNAISGIIDASADKDKAMAYYLKAIAGARNGDKDMLVNNLKTATSKDASLKAKAKKDAEFIQFRDNAEFQSAVN